MCPLGSFQDVSAMLASVSSPGLWQKPCIPLLYFHWPCCCPISQPKEAPLPHPCDPRANTSSPINLLLKLYSPALTQLWVTLSKYKHRTKHKGAKKQETSIVSNSETEFYSKARDHQTEYCSKDLFGHFKGPGILYIPRYAHSCTQLSSLKVAYTPLAGTDESRVDFFFFLKRSRRARISPRDCGYCALF